jgi:outer membrane protein assembly factor BamE (lipoprotein component of BamABCDE complex)
MLKKILTGLLSGVFAVFLPACDGGNLGKLKPGVTTMTEVREIMGQPVMEWQDADGSKTWEYPRTPQGMVNYMIDFGPNQVLLEVRQVLTEENFARVKAGMSKPEIRRLLGQPAHELYFSLKKEAVWDWKIKSEPGMDQYFNVHFNEDGMVLRSSSNFDHKG